MRVSQQNLQQPVRSALSIAVLFALYGSAVGFAHAQDGAAPVGGPDSSAVAAPAPVPAPAPVSDADAAPSDNLNKVVVTARRRAELIQDVPGAVTAVSGAELEKEAIPDITVLADRVPNTTLKTSRGTNTTLTAFIRGIGQQDPVAGYEQGVGIYLDDIYLARPQGALTDIYDLDRIEVLRGPQGTLYGRNTIGGAVKYVTRRLAPQTMFDARATLGKYGEKDLVLKASTPVNDILRLGATVATFKRDGFGRNVLTGQDNYDKNVKAARVSAELTPNSDLFVRFASDRTVDDSQPKQGYRLTAGPAPANIQPLAGDYDTRADLYSVSGHKQQVINQGSSLLVEYTIAPTLTVKSISAVRKSESYAPIDFDSLETPLFEAPTLYADNQKSQEFQLTYTGAKLQGVAGVYYMKANAFNKFDALYDALGGLSLLTYDDIDTRTWAAYADAAYNITDTFNIDLGGRWTDDQRSARIFAATYLGLAGSPALGNTNAIQFGPANTDLNKDQLNRTDKKFTPKVGIGWKLAPEHNVYATWAKGFKGGMFDPRMNLGGNPNSATSLVKRRGVDPEEVSSIELGLKSSMNGGRLQTNAAVFYTDYKNVQIPGGIATYDANGNVTGFAGTLSNAGKARIDGLELEAIAYLTNQLSLSAMVSHIDAKYKEWLVLNNAGTALVNIAGSTEFQNTPKNAANISVNYDWPLALSGRAGTLSLTNSVAYKSKVYQTEVARPTGIATLDATVPGNLALAQGGYGLWDAGLVWTSTDRKLQVGLHGRNLLDKRYKVAGYNFSAYFNSVTTFYGDPRTLLATVDVKF